MSVKPVAAYTDRESKWRFRICVRLDGLFQIATEEWAAGEVDGQRYFYWKNLYPPSGIYSTIEQAEDSLGVKSRQLMPLPIGCQEEFDLSLGPYPDL